MNLSDENSLLISCIRDGIPGETPGGTNSLLSSRIKWDEFTNTAISQGIAPLVYKRLKDIPEKSRVPEAVMDKLKMAYLGNVARNMYFYSELERILRVFNENGIEVMMLKGAALAGTVYGDIGLRAMGDIDLLVKKECLSRVKEMMPELNYEIPDHSNPEEWYSANHFHLPPYIHKEKRIVVEIHWNVAGDSLGIDVDRWWGRARKIRQGDAWVLIPSPEDMILHLCVSLYHGSYNKTALKGLCDIIHAISHFLKETDWKLFREAVDQSGIARPVYSILFLVRKYFNSSYNALSWLDHVHTDNKFTAMVENIIFSPENDPYAPFMRSLTADTKWGKTKLIYTDLFPSREKMAERYSIRPDSVKMYLYYAYRPFELAVKYGKSFLKVLCFRGSV